MVLTQLFIIFTLSSTLTSVKCGTAWDSFKHTSSISTERNDVYSTTQDYEEIAINDSSWFSVPDSSSILNDSMLTYSNNESSTMHFSKEIDVEDCVCQCNKNISFDFSNMELRMIRERFINSEDVKYLFLNDNELRSISPHAFTDLPNLVHLDLSNNYLQLATVVSNLRSFQNLKTLVLNNLNREHYDYNNFVHDGQIGPVVLPSLTKLYLENNLIREFTYPLKSLTPNLTHLYLTKNNIIYDYSFCDAMPLTLIHMDLSRNGISNFICNQMYNIRYLDLDDNDINAIEFEGSFGYGSNRYHNAFSRYRHKSDYRAILLLENAKQLKHLSLRNNKITHINPNAFQDMSKLVHLDLSYNQIEIIERNTFYNTVIMQNLSVTHNLLQSVPDVSKMEVLKYLDLSNNQIVEIYPGIFDKLTVLEKLLLNNNNIDEISNSIFAGLVNLKYLDLSCNFLMSLPSNWDYKLQQLQILHIENNQFSSFANLRFTNSTMLSDVYIQKNLIKNITMQDMLNLSRTATYHIKTDDGLYTT